MHHRDINVNHPPYGVEPDHHGNQQNGIHRNQSNGNKRFLSQVLIDMPDKRRRPVSAMGQPVKRNVFHVQKTSSYKEAHKVYTKPLPRKSNSFDIDLAQSPRNNTPQSPRNSVPYKSERQVNTKYKPSLDYNIGLDKHDGNTERSRCISPKEKMNRDKRPLPSDADSVYSSESDFEEEMTSDQECVLQGVTAREKDEILSEIIKVGDRVIISCPQKSPKYGKKIGICFLILCFSSYFMVSGYSAVDCKLDQLVTDKLMGKMYWIYVIWDTDDAYMCFK